MPNMTSFKEYLAQNEAVVQLLQLRMNKRTPGHEMTELEAWQYITWGLNELLAMLIEAAPTVGKMSTMFQPVIAQTNAGKWEAQHTGRFPDPDPGEVHFESPQAMEVARDAWRAELRAQAAPGTDAKTVSDDGYRGGTYL